MTTTILSSKGQVIIPKPLRDALHWQSGQRLEVIDVDGGLLLKPAQPFSLTTLDQVAACLPFQGPAKTVDDMQAAIEQGVKERHSDRG